MKKIILSLFALAIFGALSAQEKNYIDQNYVEVNGYANIEVEPNVIYMTITLSEENSKGKTSISELDKSMVNALQGIGIDVKKDLTLGDAASDWVKYKARKQGAMVSKTYSLKVGSARKVSEVLIALDKVGISNVDITKLENTDMKALKLKAKVEAAENARNSAESLAKALGRTLGEAIYIYDNNNEFYQSRPMFTMSKSASNDMAESYIPNIEFQNIKINATVLVKFSLK